MTRRGFLTLLVVGLLLLGLDATTKWLVQAHLPHMRDSVATYPYGGIGVFENFLGIELSLTHATNTGAVWGVFAGYQYVLLIVRLGLIVGLLGYLVMGTHTRASLWPLTMIIAGAVGNVIDLLAYGHVVDMVFFRFWGCPYAIFNLADAFISVGIGWLLLVSLLERRRRRATSDG